MKIKEIKEKVNKTPQLKLSPDSQTFPRRYCKHVYLWLVDVRKAALLGGVEP